MPFLWGWEREDKKYEDLGFLKIKKKKTDNKEVKLKKYYEPMKCHSFHMSALNWLFKKYFLDVRLVYVK